VYVAFDTSNPQYIYWLTYVSEDKMFILKDAFQK